mmetsp:Transcript_42899/g.80022  ORF Transcript_42899/g.80022 Transcript_42899/m.80022 type:complete len:612 (-) Transcript_42899:84-1919(-)
MVGGMREISNPLGVIDDLFAANAKVSSSNPEAMPPREWHEKNHFEQALQLQDEENFSKIPSLNDVELVESLPPFSLVRYRCLVQDVFEPEVYAAFLLESSTCGEQTRLVTLKYRETYQAEAGAELKDLGNAALGTRGVYYCVPLPGEAAWANSSPAQPCVAQGSGMKRPRPHEDVDMEGDSVGAITIAPTRQKCAPAPSAQVGKNSDTFGLNFPLPWEEQKRGTSCIVKLYDTDEDCLKLCETVEVVGVLCVDPAMANFGDVPAWTPFRDARNPSTAMVPRLHGLCVRKLPCYHPMFPFTPQWLSEERLACAFQRRLAAHGAAAARTAAISLLQEAVGDKVAVEYLLALLASRVYGNANGMPLGQWSLNIRGADTSDASLLFQALQELVPRAVCLPVTVETLNAERWPPQKDFDANRLLAGRLQLSAGTLLMLDETQMQEGKVTEDGVKALQAIQTMVSSQTLLCDFMQYNVRIPVEVKSLVVSKGTSVLKAADVILPLCSETPFKSSYQANQTPRSLDASRFLLGLITRQTRQVRLPECVVAALSEDYVKLRERFEEVGQSIIHFWMSLARGICLSHGEDELSLVRWRSIFELEKQRLQRLVDAGLLQLR